MKTKVLCNRYINAFERTLSANRREPAFAELRRLVTAVEDSEDLRAILKNPLLSEQNKRDVMFPLIAAENKAIASFLNVLFAKGRAKLLVHMGDVVQHALDRARDQIEAAVESKIALSESQKTVINKYLSDMAQKPVSPTFIENETMIGGFRARIDNTILDASIESTLADLKGVFKA